jgi:hypothetical protein
VKKLLSALGVAILLAAGPASADLIFDFSGVSFDDGGTLTGSFITDDGTTSLLDWDVTTSGGTLPGFHYTSSNTVSFSSITPLGGILVVETAGLEHLLQVTFAGPLSPSGAGITLGMFDSFEQTPGGPPQPHRVITAGSAVVGTTAVPEPSTIALLGIAVLGVAGFVRRNRQR